MNLLNKFIALTFGVVGLVVNIVFLGLMKNLEIELSSILIGTSDLESKIDNEMKAGILAVDTISTLKPIGILIWAFVSQLYVKSQKVSSILTLKSSYLALMGVWTLLVIV